MFCSCEHCLCLHAGSCDSVCVCVFLDVFVNIFSYVCVFAGFATLHCFCCCVCAFMGIFAVWFLACECHYNHCHSVVCVCVRDSTAWLSAGQDSGVEGRNAASL